MKKVILLFGLFMTLCAAGSYAQTTPTCQNDNALEARIDAIEASGWVELSRTFIPFYYDDAPVKAPFLLGTLQIVFGVDCAPGEACPKIARLYREDATFVNENVCVWSPSN